MVGLDGRYYNPSAGRSLDVKSLVGELEHLIAKLPSAGQPERPSRDPQPQTVRQLRSTQAEAIICGYRAGTTLKRLGEVHGLNRQAISRILKQAGVPLRRRGLTDEQVRDALGLYEEGQSLAQIGRQFDVDAGTVRSRLIERGVAMRDTAGRTR